MKTYNVKFDIGQDVYILLSKKIIKSRINKIKIEHSSPYVDGETMEQKDGIEIYYLISVGCEQSTISGSKIISYDWYNQDDVFLDKDELIRKII